MDSQLGHWDEVDSAPRMPDLALSLICYKPVCDTRFGIPSVVSGTLPMWASRVWLEETKVEVSFPWKGAQVVKRIPWYLLGQDLCL